MTLTLRLELLLGVSLFLSFFQWGRKILFPLQVFTTWIHECWHAVMAMLLGASSVRITISPDGSGLTHYKIPKGRIRQGIIASSGYLGAALSGCGIFFLTFQTRNSSVYWNIRTMVIFLCIVIGLSLVCWIRNFFGFFSVLLMGGALAALQYSPLNQYAQDALFFISIQTGLNALFDLRTLLSLGGKKNGSDAYTMQKLFFLPHWVWTLCWLCISLFMMHWTIQHTL